MSQRRMSPASFDSSIFELQSLEKRVLMSGATPQAVIPATVTPSALLNQTVRTALVGRLPSGGLKNTLAPLVSNASAFDTALLNHMRTKVDARFYFGPNSIDDFASYIVSKNLEGNAEGLADDLLLHKFPEQGDGSTYPVQLPNNIDWDNTSYNSLSEFLPGLNRFAYWRNLSEGHLYTGDGEYMQEIINELSSWSSQNAVPTDATKWSTTGGVGWDLLTASLRAESWVWTYAQVLGSNSWTKEANTLFVSRMYDLGDFLYKNRSIGGSGYELTSNRSLFHAKGLLLTSQVFSDFATAGTWETAARGQMIDALNTQIYEDGSHFEQSPGYASNVISDLLESRYLDEINNDGAQWPAATEERISDALEAYRQELMPDGTLPAVGDTLRNTAGSIFFKAKTTYGTADPGDPLMARPRTRDVWLFGEEKVDPFMGLPAQPSLGARGKTFALADSGNYIFRSGNDTDARQFIFDAGPTGGGAHGHLDLLNFELYGYGRPLISDPGEYIYGQSSGRSYVVSTPSHNTISVGGKSHAYLEGAGNPSIIVDDYDVDGSHAQITVHHFGYEYVSGSPVLTRSIWYDLDGTMVIVDWAEGNTAQTITQAFNLQTEGDTTNVSAVQGDQSIKTRYASGGNVRIAPVYTPAGQTATRSLKFVTNDSSGGDYMDDAYRYTVSQTGTFVAFVTLVTAYDGLTVPDTTAAVISGTPAAGQAIQVELTENGTPETLTFTPPALTRPVNPNANIDLGGANDMAYDSSGRLHVVFHDRLEKSLKYTVRDTNGKWSIVQTIDNAENSGGGHLSLALDSKGLPGVAYFDGSSGDLKYAKFRDNAWVIEKVDTSGSVGLNPSLIFSRKDGPMISYYHKTKGDLRLAVSGGGGWIISTIDYTGNVGRWTKLMLDPNRPDSSKAVILYEDSTNGDYKVAIQGTFGDAESQSNAGYSLYRIDNLAHGGGYTSLAFRDTHATTGNRYQPAAAYYDGATMSLRYAYKDDAGWHASNVVTGQRRGLYNNLFFDTQGKPNIFYWNRNLDSAWRAKGGPGAWTFTSLGKSGRSMRVTQKSTGAIAFSTQEDSQGYLRIEYLGS